MKIFLLTLFLSLPAISAEICEAPGGGTVPKALADLMPAIDATALEWWSVSPTQYMSAPCKNHSIPDVDAWLTAQETGRRRDRRIKGFRFEDQSNKLLEAFEDIVKFLPEQDSQCRTVLCAVDEIWGAPLGRKILYARARHGYNTSEFSQREARRLRDSEMDDILKTMADLPPEMEMIGRGGNQPLFLALEGVTSRVNPRASADALITLYDAWRNSPDPFGRQYGLFHEFGHNMSDIADRIDRGGEWRDTLDCNVSTYGENSNREDFAETFVMYRFNARALRERCPVKYTLLKTRVFNNREYLDESQCR